jgi:glycosyltransferase involved in cell wall biosynthesis
MTTKPEIIIATTLRDERGITGVQTQFSVFRDYLVGIDYPARVITPFNHTRAIVYPVFAVRKLLGSLRHRRSLWWYRTWHYRFVRAALRRVFAENENVIVYAQDPQSARAALETRTKGQPVVLAMHNAQSEADEWVSHGAITSASPLYASIQRQELATLTKVDRLVFASELQRSDVTAIYPELNQADTVVMSEFVDVPATKSVAPTRDAITVGMLEARKNHRFLVGAIGAAKAAGHSFTLTIVGEGPERSALEAQIAQLGLEGQVTLTGQIPSDQIGYAIEDHRVYLHSSRQESFGLAIVEAMAVGLPVVIGNVGGVAELLEEGKEAWFWPDLDHAQHGAELLISLLNDPDALKSLAHEGAARFKQSFSVDAVAPELLSYLISEDHP